ncbi:MAG: vitamin K epoxide reductase family protein [Candidatus Tyrphobacter sp.]
MVVSSVITVLCGVGLYASLFMLGKARQAERGLLAEPSVVQSPRARLLAGTPNASFGVCYYVLAAAFAWLPAPPAVAVPVMVAVLAAAATSLFLAYSLLFVTKRSCPYCWSAHAVNWLLVFLFLLHDATARPLR